MTREEIIKYLNIIKAFFLGSEHQPISDAYFALDEAIKELEQVPKKGKWTVEIKDMHNLEESCMCSRCGALRVMKENDRENFCYRCGADMREENLNEFIRNKRRNNEMY